MKNLNKLFTSLFFLFQIIYFTSFPDNCKSQWVQMSNGIGTSETAMSFASNGAYIFAGISGGVYISSDNGINWTSKGFSDRNVWALLYNGGYLFAGMISIGICRSSDNGDTWDTVSSGLTNKFVKGFAVIGSDIFACTDGGGVFLSTNNGETWTAVNNGMTSLGIKSILASGTNLFAGGNAGKLYFSTNKGANWSLANNGIPLAIVNSLAAIGTNLFAGTGSGVFLSTDNGGYWSPVSNGLSSTGVNSIIVNGTNLFAGTGYGGGVFLSTNNGSSWTDISQGYGSGNIPITYSLLTANNYIFSATANQSIWRRPLAEILVLINIDSEVTSEYVLKQNFPNPFNPVTNLEFGIANPGYVSLKIFDLPGKEVVTLVNEKLYPGTYRVKFDAGSLTSGVYFCKLNVNNFQETKRMLLIK